MTRTPTLRSMAEDGYIMGLQTIGEVAVHMDLHYDLYFSIDNFAEEMRAFADVVRGHEDESIDLYLTAEDKKRMDDELDAAMAESPTPEVSEELREASDESEEEGEQENKHF